VDIATLTNSEITVHFILKGFGFSAGQAHEPLFMTIDPDLSKQRHG
jgi:hypothetical protein